MTSAIADATLRLADGRALGFAVLGDPAGTPLLFLHGTPGSRSQFAIAETAARELRLAIIAPDRWGYGQSDVPASPSLPRFAADMAALMDHLGHPRFAVGGLSGGGPYAASVAACLSARVTALALISPVGPIATPAVRGSLSRFHRFCFTVLPHWPVAVRAAFGIFEVGLRRSPRIAAELATLRAGPRDKALIADPEIAHRLLGSFREGLRQGTSGPVIDLRLFSQPWGVDLGVVRSAAHLWIGTADTAVPIGAAHALARALPSCTTIQLPDEGHFWMAERYREILDWVVDATNTAASAETTYEQRRQ